MCVDAVCGLCFLRANFVHDPDLSLRRGNEPLGYCVEINRKYLTEDRKFFKVHYCIKVYVTRRTHGLETRETNVCNI